ncbi:protein eiger [Tribolium madens]|uniref:protein eiger n=1 Tax=Tribolium madens TaxID=41895 RepID=UPI001CF75451|nr:protein eiger [Tribolium madens]
MKNEECKLPIQEDHRAFIKKPNSAIHDRSSKIFVIAALILLAAMSLMIAITFISINGMQELKEEVDSLKATIKSLQEKIEEEINRNNTKTNFNLNDDYPNWDDTANEYYLDFDGADIYDDTYYDQLESDNISKLTGEPYTKDAKEATAPPREKRSITGYTEDEPTVNAEQYGEERRRNNTLKKNYPHYYTTPPSSFRFPFYPETKTHSEEQDWTSSPRPFNSRKSRIMQSEGSPSTRENPDFEFITAHTRHRQRRLELDEHQVRTGRMRPLPSAHFSGDTSKYVYGQHENFNGNGHLRHPHTTYVDWVESDWFSKLGMDQYFSFSDGLLTVKEPGLYFIYAQIFYYDIHDTNGFRVYRNENETLLQCTTMTHSSERVMKGNTCFTAAANYLNENDKISLVDLSEARYSLFEPGKSFFGVIKLGDVKIK